MPEHDELHIPLHDLRAIADVGLDPLAAGRVEAGARRAFERRRTRARTPRGRWILGIGAGVVVLAGGGAAASGVLHLDEGTTPGRDYVIDRTSPPAAVAGEPERAGSICLQLAERHGGGVAYGCGDRPTRDRRFGVVIADAGDASRERVIYGLVADDVRTVSVLGAGTAHTDGRTTVKRGLPGRYFRVVVPNRGRIEVVGLDAEGAEIARIGSRATPTRPATSREEARAQGALAGFAPAVAMPGSFVYRGGTIAPAEAARRGLVCDQDRSEVRCFDTLGDLDAARRPDPGR
ncbi:hypothetical protein AB0L40_04035 [Patulibacter sp. NPDC049589]|uniref:hypothetical protein n=1 Tax=Patulibacter sp. NPDC049589 TaxID=3154731 RepID=UPI00342AD541